MICKITLQKSPYPLDSMVYLGVRALSFHLQGEKMKSGGIRSKTILYNVAKS